LLIAVSICLSLGAATAIVRADYVLNSGLETYRIRDNGTLVGYYTPPPAEVEETTGEDYAVTPDLQTLYQFTNALGFSNLIFGFDVLSRQYQPDKNLHSGGCCFPDVSGDAIINPRMSLIRANDPLGAGDLFTISALFGYPFDATPQIKRYDRETDAYVESIDPPTPQRVYDFAFGPDNRLYMAAEDGIFVYEESAGGFGLLSPAPLINDVTGTIAFGPDGRLYVRNVGSGDVDRYTTAGEHVDTFIPAAEIPELGGSPVGDFFVPARGSIQFGVDGNLHLLLDVGVGKFSGSTGDLLATALLDPFVVGAYGRVTYLPVPEPASLLLILPAFVCLSGRILRK
jgi:hypothetical protein